MICDTINEGGPCIKLVNPMICEVYPPKGMMLRDKLGYCPLIDAGPNKKVRAINSEKIRIGQQKAKKT